MIPKLRMALLGVMACAIGSLVWSPPALSEETALTVTLEALDTQGPACFGTFRMDNALGRDIGFMTLEIAVQRNDGQPGRLFSLALMPSRRDTTTRAILPVLDSPCAVVSDLLVNRVDVCRDRAGAPLECDSTLKATSETATPLTK